MRIATLLMLLSVFVFSANAQEISVFPGMWSVEYYQDDQRITKEELKALFAKNKEVQTYWKKSNVNSTLAAAAIGTELAFAIWTGIELAKDDGNSLIPGVGTLGFAIIGGIFINGANKNGKKAILTYNKQFDKRTSFYLTPVSNQNGLGLALKF